MRDRGHADFLDSLWADVVAKIEAYEAVREDDSYGGWPAGEMPDTPSQADPRWAVIDAASTSLGVALLQYLAAHDDPARAVRYKGVVYTYSELGCKSDRPLAIRIPLDQIVEPLGRN